MASASHEGTMVRVARWLVATVGVDNVFTKHDLRTAFPGVGQVDRRMRDLRDFDWVIHTNREDASLRPEELRFVAAGQPVWESRKNSSAVSGAERRAALLAAGFACARCGTRAGEPFADRPSRTATLSVSFDRALGAVLVLCQLCRESGGLDQGSATVSRLSELWKSFDIDQRDQLLLRLAGRPDRRLDLAEAIARSLPPTIADAVFKGD